MAEEPGKSLNVIRFALLVTPLFLALSVWIVAAEGGLKPEVFQGMELYVTAVLIIVFLGFFGGILALRSRWQAAEDFEAKKRADIIGWVLAEAASLLGIVYLFLVGNASFFGAGLALQGLASFVLLPMPEPDASRDA